MPLTRPRADFRESALVVFSTVFPDGTTDFASPIGSGPYKLDRSDQRTVSLVANDQYWAGEPKVRRLEILRIADTTRHVTYGTSGPMSGVIASRLHVHPGVARMAK